MNTESSVHYGKKPVYEKSSSWWKWLLAAIIVVALGLLLSGCVAFNNGHGQVAPLTAESELVASGDATITTEREITGPDGKVTRDKHTVTKSEAAADLELKSKELDNRRDIGVERERRGGSRAGGFLSWLFTPTYPVYGYSGGYYGSAGYSGSYGGNVDNWVRNSQGTGALGGTTLYGPSYSVYNPGVDNWSRNAPGTGAIAGTTVHGQSYSINNPGLDNWSQNAPGTGATAGTTTHGPSYSVSNPGLDNWAGNAPGTGAIAGTTTTQPPGPPSADSNADYQRWLRGGP